MEHTTTIENFRLKREMIRLASDIASGDLQIMNRYMLTREELEILSMPVQNELLKEHVKTLEHVLSTRKRKSPEPPPAVAGQQQASSQQQPLAADFSQQHDPSQQSPAGYSQQPPHAGLPFRPPPCETTQCWPHWDRYPPQLSQQPPAEYSQQPHDGQHPPRYPHPAGGY